MVTGMSAEVVDDNRDTTERSPTKEAVGRVLVSLGFEDVEHVTFVGSCGHVVTDVFINDHLFRSYKLGGMAAFCTRCMRTVPVARVASAAGGVGGQEVRR
jgi:hypothetical protein